MNDNENKTNAPINLLPCPFCGGKAKLWERNYSSAKYAVGCSGKEYCYAWIPSNVRLSELHTYTSCFVGKQDAIDCWNKRAALNEADALRAEVENAVQKALDVHQAMVTTYRPTGQQVHACEMCDALNDIAAAIKPNAAAGEEGTE